MSEFSIALVGNPNCGKTTLFNALTGAQQRVGNWPGVTVEKKTGRLVLQGKPAELIDLPGIYSLEQDYLGLDEKIAREYLAAEPVDCVINIVDGSNLERNLVLTQQLLELDLPIIVAVNMLDVARQQGIEIDAEGLAERLGVQVIPIIAAKSEGLTALAGAVLNARRPGRVETPDLSLDTTDRLVKRYYRSKQLVDGVMQVTPVLHPLTERIDAWVLNRYLGIPFFLLMMYLMFTIAINLGAVFIDFFDILFGAVFVDGTRWLLTQADLPDWMMVLLADGLGSGIQLVATFVPVIGFLFLCLSVLEDSGYMSRAAFVVDRLMSKLGLPGTAFVPLIVGFGCNVPAVMAARTLGRDSDRLLTIAMAPFMSCGARLTVYALFAAAFYPDNGQNIVFLLYLLGIFLAVLTGFLFRRQIFKGEITPSFQEMPAYHIPVMRNILLTTWSRLRSFVMRAGKTIVMVVIALSFLNSLSFDGSFGHEDTETSALATIGKAITPVFEPMGLTEDNWPATVGLFTGIFAKEAVVGTLDALYSEPIGDPEDLDLVASAWAALTSVADNTMALTDTLFDPLGLSIGDVSDASAAASEQGVTPGTLTNMAGLFGSQLAAFSYLVFILLYAPCVAVLAAMVKEAGWRWMMLVFGWTTALAYTSATSIYQLGNLFERPAFASLWVIGCFGFMVLFVASLRRLGQRAAPVNLIPTVQLGNT